MSDHLTFYFVFNESFGQAPTQTAGPHFHHELVSRWVTGPLGYHNRLYQCIYRQIFIWWEVHLFATITPHSHQNQPWRALLHCNILQTACSRYTGSLGASPGTNPSQRFLSNYFSFAIADKGFLGRTSSVEFYSNLFGRGCPPSQGDCVNFSSFGWLAWW